MGLEKLEPRHLLSALPLGATTEDTGEFLLGRVAVVPVLFESTGQSDPSTEDWTAAQIDAAIEKVRTGVQWWADTLDTLGTVHTLEFVVDDTFARNPFPTPYEPINRTSQESPLYITPFLRAQGIEQAASLEDAVRQFNNTARNRLQTDWAFTVFLVHSAADADGAFAPGSEFNIAFAFAGGLYVVSPSTRPASTITHETGHIFWAKDEYPGGATWSDRRGYYDAQNLNAADNPTPDFEQEPSIMSSGTALSSSYNSRYLPASTRAMLGWLDSDGDGIFDVADVPLHLEGDGSYDSPAGVFRFEGQTRAVPLANRNSSGPGNDITLNRIDRIEYRTDGGLWQTAANVDAQSADVRFDLSVAPFTVIEFRAIDDQVGVSSPVLRAMGLGPLLPENAVGGFAYVDSGGEGEVDPSASLLASVTATLTKADGSPLFHGSIEPDNHAPGEIPAVVSGAAMTAWGTVLDGRVGAFTAPASTEAAAFHYYNLQNAQWQNDWSVDRQLLVEFAEPVGQVQLDAIGLSLSGGYGRLEAYDSAGILLHRVTTEQLAQGETATMQVTDRRGQIASVRGFGHQFSEVGLDALRFGDEGTVITGQSGAFRFTGLSDGDYKLTLTPERLIHHYQDPETVITVVNGIVSHIAAGFDRVASPWLNPFERFDVDGNGRAEPLDALRIINNLSRHGIRILADPTQITGFFDTSDDGAITPLDALRVINELARRARQTADSEAMPLPTDQVFAAWNADLEKDKLRNPTQVSWYSGEPIG